ncbi:hypothetical protein F4604DRAFT_1675628 [Suillus subluteus]|nr:hypothetical protein F4604DRAFT_1675628 [Suillus subluteus]
MCIISLALAASALANVFITSPVGSTTFTAGQQATVSWQDDGTSPNLTSFGPALIGIYTGNADQQVDSTFSSFVRFTSISLTDATNPQYPAEAFSAKFTMTGMTGTFNSTIQAEINGQSTAPIGVPATSSSSASGTMVTVATTSAAGATFGSTTTPSTSSTSATATSTGAAGKIGVTGITCFVGAAASLLGAMLL